jgi:hypothetical protein
LLTDQRLRRPIEISFVSENKQHTKWPNLKLSVTLQLIIAWFWIQAFINIVDGYWFEMFWPFLVSRYETFGLFVIKKISWTVIVGLHIFRPFDLWRFDFSAFRFSAFWFSGFWFFIPLILAFWVSAFWFSAFRHRPMKVDSFGRSFPVQPTIQLTDSIQPWSPERRVFSAECWWVPCWSQWDYARRLALNLDVTVSRLTNCVTTY